MTVLLGPCPCASCGEIVTVVRRPVLIAGHGTDCPKKVAHPYCALVESTELRHVVVLDDGQVHLCRLAIAHPFDYTTSAGASGEPNRLNVAPVSQLAPGARASFHVGSKTT